jgi:hypothetical protein
MNEKDSALVLAAENGQTDTVRLLKEWMARGESGL